MAVKTPRQKTGNIHLTLRCGFLDYCFPGVYHKASVIFVLALVAPSTATFTFAVAWSTTIKAQSFFNKELSTLSYRVNFFVSPSAT